MSALVLVRYGELALKSPPVRREFEGALQRNIVDQFHAAEVSCRLRSDRGHLYVEADEAAVAVRLLRRVFGVTSVSPVTEVPSEPEAIGEALVRLAGPRLTPHASFAVRARRTGRHAFTSQDLARDLGGTILESFRELGLSVDLEHPDVELFVEVRANRTYLSLERFQGPGGLPLGVAGRVVALVDGPRGALGAWMMMKRGCRCGIVATGDGGPLALEVLRRFDPKSSVPPVVDRPSAPSAVRELADLQKVDGIVLALSVDEYASARSAWGDRVVFSPTVGLTDEEVDARWQSVAKLAT